jgi:hypothetical protein
MIDKIKELLSKDNEGNKKIIFVGILLFVIAIYTITGSLRKDKTKIEGNPEVSQANSQVIDEVLKQKKEEAIKQELSKAGIEEEKKEEKKEEKNQEKVVIQPPPTDLTTQLGNLNNPDYEDLRKKIDELEKKQYQTQQKISKENIILTFASSQIGRQVDYSNQTQQPQPAPIQPQADQQLSQSSQSGVYELEGTLLDNIKLAVGQSKIVRIQTEKGIILTTAKATQIGITFDNQGKVVKDGREIKAYVQVEGQDGSTNLFTYVISPRNEIITKAAILGFIQGAATGLADRSYSTSALGTTTENIKGGLMTGLSKGVESGANILVQQEQNKIRTLVDQFVLIKGEKLKVLLIEGGI